MSKTVAGKKIMMSIITVAGLILMILFALGIMSHYQVPDSGLLDGKLRACPSSPNCVCSEAHSAALQQHAIEPFMAGQDDMDTAWSKMKQAVEAAGGKFRVEEPDYLHAEFTSTIFRFVDDFELRADRQAGVIHVRSASRVGRSDLGANRKRVEKIWGAMESGL
jgi:uncharacterized protein (DUF1499 family)